MIYQKCDLLTNELIGLERMSSGKIDHTPDGINSKDQADAVCGALYLASQYAEEYAFNYGESLEASLDVSTEYSDNALKTQMIVNFQEELAKLYTDTCAELDECDERERIARQNEYLSYKDILDGIIAF